MRHGGLLHFGKMPEKEVAERKPAKRQGKREQATTSRNLEKEVARAFDGLELCEKKGENWGGELAIYNVPAVSPINNICKYSKKGIYNAITVRGCEGCKDLLRGCHSWLLCPNRSLATSLQPSRRLRSPGGFSVLFACNLPRGCSRPFPVLSSEVGRTGLWKSRQNGRRRRRSWRCA